MLCRGVALYTYPGSKIDAIYNTSESAPRILRRESTEGHCRPMKQSMFA